MAGIRKREIIGIGLVVALFGAIASPAFALTADLGQTSVSADTVTNVVQRGSTGSSSTTGGSDVVPDKGEVVTHLADAVGKATGAKPQPNPTPVPPVPKTVTRLTGTATDVVDTAHKDTSTIVRAVAEGDTTKTLTRTAAIVQDPVSTGRTLVDATQKDPSTVVAAIVQDPVSTGRTLVDATQKDPSTVVGIVAGGGPPSGTDVPADTSPGHPQPPPGAHARDGEPLAVNRPADAPPGRFTTRLLPSEQVTARTFVALPRHPGATARGGTSGAGTTSVNRVPLPLHSPRLLGVGSRTSSAAVDLQGAPFPKLPRIPPRPELPALGGMFFSTSFSFGSIAALGVMPASMAARTGFIRRLALARGRPVGFALLLERPG